jgi:nitroreductase
LVADDAAAAVLEDLLASRWSCREFLPGEVPHEEIVRILDIARRSASWCNTQPWHVDVTSGAATEQLRAALAESLAAGNPPAPDIPFPGAYEGVYQQRRRESGWQLYESLGIDKGDREASMRQTLRNFDFFGAPHVAIITTERDLGPYGAVDCGIFIANLLLAAHSRGVASIPQAALATQSPVLRQHFGLPDSRQVLVGISFGYPQMASPVNHYRTARQSIDELVTFH